MGMYFLLHSGDQWPAQVWRMLWLELHVQASTQTRRVASILTRHRHTFTFATTTHSPKCLPESEVRLPLKLLKSLHPSAALYDKLLQEINKNQSHYLKPKQTRQRSQSRRPLKRNKIISRNHHQKNPNRKHQQRQSQNRCLKSKALILNPTIVPLPRTLP